jgi:predicted dehydrogenase
MEGFHYLFHPITQRMFGLLDDGTLGTLQHVEVVMKMPEPKPDDARWSLQLASGCVMDLGSYGLHATRHLAPFPGGDPPIAGARPTERSTGVDESFDVDLTRSPNEASGCVVSLDDGRRARDAPAPDRR